ncbi:MAG: sterol desaturase family protein [Candidatus Xenobia bacterium]
MMDDLGQYAWAFAVDVTRLTIWLALLMAIFVPLERAFPLRPIRLWRKQIAVDLAWYFINGLVPSAVVALPLSVLARALQGADPGGLYSAVAAWPLGLKLLAALVVSDVGSYWGHRAMHFHPRLWRFHAVHHSAEHVDWLVNTRGHPFDLIFTKLTGLVPIYLLGLAQSIQQGLDPVVVMVTIVGLVWSYFIHANLRIRLGFLEWLVATPAFHHWHHTNDAWRDRNFAAIFPFIDRVFGTAWLPAYWPPEYGTDAKVATGLAGQLMDPLIPANQVPDEAVI